MVLLVKQFAEAWAVRREEVCVDVLGGQNEQENM
jgi:hypothetical protein